MKKLVLALSLSLASMPLALTSNAHAQTVVLNGLGSSALFLEAGLGTTKSPISAQCWWTGNNGASNAVIATDTKGGQTVTDAGNAWVAWTTGGGTCSAPSSTAKVWAYLQTDSVVGNRCLFNAHTSPATCTIAHPATNPASSGLLFPANDATKSETALPTTIATALNNHTTAPVNFAGTDIRPEDAVFAVARAVVGCGTAIGSTQYLGLGYDPTSTDSNANSVKSFFSGSVFHTTQFTLPVSYFVTPIGATPVVVAVNGFSGVTNITSATLAQFLDGTFSYTGQASGAGATGSAVTTLIREPLSGTYNTMEYNVPNRTLSDGTYLFQTSQDVGLRQPNGMTFPQRDCNPSDGAPKNPMNIATPSGGHRRRAIGTGQELAEVLDTTNNGANILGYGFWSAANYKPFSSSTTTHYLTVDGVDPLRTTSVSGNPIPTSTTALANVTLSNVKNGTYPIWSLIRFVTADSTSKTNADNLATATKSFTVFGGSNPRPDFIVSDNLTVVRSHFIPPAGTTQPSAAADGNVGLPSSFCTNPEAGGDVGGAIITLATDSNTCISNPNGDTGHRR